MPNHAFLHPAMMALAAIFTLAFGMPQALATELYTCGMHPQIIRKEPGNCPVCEMKLTPVTSQQNQGAVDGLRIDATTAQRMNLKTAIVERGPVHREWRATGIVAYNEKGLHDITAKYEGWIEKLHVNTTWTKVKNGDQLFEIYSPELYNAQLNYAAAIRSSPSANDPLAGAALARLRHYDVSDADIMHIRDTGKVPRTLIFRAPTEGVVIEKMAVAGQMIKPGERIYRIADLNTVWVNAQIYEKDLPFVSEGQAATVHTSYAPDALPRNGIVQQVLPQVDEQTRSATIRITLPNADNSLRPGMFVTVKLAAQLATDAVLVPDSAVLRSGGHDTVFIALDGGLFKSREVKLGARSTDNYYQVLSGLDAGERIVTSGQFLLDSESRLREAVQKMFPGDVLTKPAMQGQAHTPAQNNTSIDSALTALVNVAADAAGALALDDLATYKQLLPTLKDALQQWLSSNKTATPSPMEKFLKTVQTMPDIATARHDFEAFSTNLANLVRNNRASLPSSIHIFECEMAPSGKSRWIQRTPGAKNPFYGSTMLRCGTEIEPPSSKPTTR